MKSFTRRDYTFVEYNSVQYTVLSAAYDSNILFSVLAEKLTVWFLVFQVKDRDSNTPLLGHQDRESEVKKINKDSLV